MKVSFRFVALLCLLLGLWTVAGAGQELSLSIPRGMRGYQEQTITVTVPSDGTCDLEITSCGAVYWRETGIAVTAGENRVTWNGAGFDGEVIPAANYHMTASFTDLSGETTQVTSDFTMKKPAQALMYFLPDSDTLWLDDSMPWYYTLATTNPGQVLMKLAPAEQPEE